MVAIKKIQSPKKKSEGEGTSWHVTRGANAPNVMSSTLYFATVSLRIYDEFQNDERGKEKDRWCRRFYYYIYDKFQNDERWKEKDRWCRGFYY